MTTTNARYWFLNRRDWLAYLVDRARGRRLCGGQAKRLRWMICDRRAGHEGTHRARRYLGPGWYRRRLPHLSVDDRFTQVPLGDR